MIPTRRLFARRDRRPSTDDTTVLPPSPPMTDAAVRELFGYAPDDPNVEVIFMPLDGERVTAPGNFDARFTDAHDSAAASKIDSIIDAIDRKTEELLGQRPRAVRDVYEKLADDIKAQEDNMKPAPVYDQSTCPVAETATEKNLRIAPALDAIMSAVRDEVLRANGKHAPMHSPHEGHSVILEELDELWDEVKADRGRQASARKEAIQVACTAIRYVLDLDPH